MAYQPDFWPFIMGDLPPFNNDDTFYQLHDDHVNDFNALMMMTPCMPYDIGLSMGISSVQQQPSYTSDMLMSGAIGWDDFPSQLPLEYSPPQMQMQAPIVADVTDARQRALHGSISSNGGTPGSYESSIIQDTRSSSMESSGNNSSRSPESSSPSVKVGSKRKAEAEVGQEVARKRHRKKFSDEAKKETHRTRLEGACLRCQKNRKRCKKVEGACCQYCNTLLDAQIPNTPYFRSRLGSSELFRKGPTDEFLWTRRRWLKTSFDDAKVWKSDAKKLYVTQGMGIKLELRVKQYDPQPEDKDTYTWVGGALTMPRFAVADIEGAQDAINQYINDHTQSYIRTKIGPNELIPWYTFQMAVRLSNDGSSLLRNALRLWTASRIIEDPWEIIGQETLGVKPSADKGSPYYGKVPVTPVMDFQIDNITIQQILIPMKKRLLADLQKKIMDNKQQNFLEIFLTIYILLHNIELTIAHDRWFAQRWNVPSKFSNYPLIGSVFEGANIMLTHFHYVTKGYAPFAQDWNKPPSPAKLKQDEIDFLAAISNESRRQASSLRTLKQTSQYESPMYWCSQLFYEGWQPVASPCA